MDVRQCPIAGDTHRVQLVQARAGAPVSRLLYLLDGDAALAALQPDWLARQPELALVAIGYPGIDGFDAERRSRDYTPPPPRGWDGAVRRALARPHGGAAQFLSILTDTVMPAVDSMLGTPVPQAELWGHSYGGLFSLWVLTQGGAGFARIHAGSPSLWWGDYALEQVLLAGTFQAPGVRQVSLSMGADEVSRKGERLYNPERLRALVSTLRERSGIPCQATIFPGTGHGAAFAASLELAISSA